MIPSSKLKRDIARLYGLASYYFIDTYYGPNKDKRPTNAEEITVYGEELGYEWSCDEWTMYKKDYDTIQEILSCL